MELGLYGVSSRKDLPYSDPHPDRRLTGRPPVRFEIVCLVPVTLCLFIGLPLTDPAGKGDTWNVAIFFTFISLSRIGQSPYGPFASESRALTCHIDCPLAGLWAFDLFQLQQLQEALKDHPRRNRLTAFQLSLTSLFDLGKYGMVLGSSSLRALTGRP